MRILVIDDEAIIRSVARSLLAWKGYEVLLAGSGAEALEIVRQERDSIALVLLDFAMPGLTGEQTSQELRALLPDVPIVLMSGYGKDEILSRAGTINPAAFLHKPFEALELLNTIQRLAPLPSES